MQIRGSALSYLPRENRKRTPTVSTHGYESSRFPVKGRRTQNEKRNYPEVFASIAPSPARVRDPADPAFRKSSGKKIEQCVLSAVNYVGRGKGAANNAL
jgi:hypothetical protein